MPQNLVIVESPAKAKTIQKFLGEDFKVMSSKGHIRDLHKKDFSIDVEHGFMPIYEIPDEKKKTVDELRKAASGAKTVWLASDEDREGEAIAWHLQEALKLKPADTKRIVFHEITKPAILAAIESPRDIDRNLVDAQQARRVLDRIVGFELSPVLWKKIKPALSAGRVQSVAVRLIAEREREIESFTPEAYWRVTAEIDLGGGTVFTAELNRRMASKKEALDFLESCKGASMTVSDVTVKPVKKSPTPPFTTSTLQQEASRRLGFPVALTMRLAQSLYEAGHITYMRTDSLNLSKLALNTIAKEITGNLGDKYLHVRQWQTKSKGAQEAHEAIRPTFVATRNAGATAQEKKLYELIWKRAVASQMADAELERTSIEISITGRNEHFVVNGEVVKFDGFLKVYEWDNADDSHNGDDKGSSDSKQLPPIHKGDSVTAESITVTERFSQQPPRYNEAMLVRKLEELGIGRPSTYAPTISTIQQRGYVERGEKKGEKRAYELLTLKNGKITERSKSETTGAEKGKLIPTDIGMVVNDFLLKYFPNIMDYNFTAKIEDEFDDIAGGKSKWNDEIAKFYKNFHPNIEKVSSLRLEHKVGERILGNDPKTGRPVSVKIGRYGPLVQLGSTDEKEKPRFASLQKGQSVATLTLQEALKLFEMPRTLGEKDGKEVTVAIGRFGPYVKYDSTFASIPSSLSPYDITLKEALDLVETKKTAETNKVINSWAQEPELLILNGRFGPYISYKKKNYKIAKGTDAAKLTLEQAMAIVSDEANASKKGFRRTRSTSGAKK